MVDPSQVDRVAAAVLPVCAKGRENPDMRTVTVRMPAALHEKLRNEAHDSRVSMNKLCVIKLNTSGDLLESLLAELDPESCQQ